MGNKKSQLESLKSLEMRYEQYKKQERQAKVTYFGGVNDSFHLEVIIMQCKAT